MISGDADWFLKIADVHQGGLPSRSTPRRWKGCPDDCGLCPDHEQHVLPIIGSRITVTSSAHLHRAESAQLRHDEGGFGRILDGLVEKEADRDDQPPAASPRCTRSSSNSSTWRAQDGDLAYPSPRTVFAARPIMRFARRSRSGNHLAPARRPQQSGSCMSSAAPATSARPARRRSRTSSAGVEDDHRLHRREGRERRQDRRVHRSPLQDFILSLTFQPAAFTGYGGAHFAPQTRWMWSPSRTSCAARRLSTGGRLSKSDFLPLPCSHLRLLRIDLSPQDGRSRGQDGLHPVSALPRARRSTSRSRQSRHHPPGREIRDTIRIDHRRDVDERRSGARSGQDHEGAPPRHLPHVSRGPGARLEERLNVGESLVRRSSFTPSWTCTRSRSIASEVLHALRAPRRPPDAGLRVQQSLPGWDARYTGEIGKPKIWGC